MAKGSRSPRKPIKGERFGRLVVVSESEHRNKQGYVLYVCTCDCGGSNTRRASDLYSGRVKSCGCFRRDAPQSFVRKRPPKEAALHAFIQRYKRGAKERSIDFDLSDEEFVSISSLKCFYCGASPKEMKSKSKFKTELFTNGLDRVNNDEGYRLNNCVSCCSDCNVAKRALSLEEFEDLIVRQYETLVSRRASDLRSVA